MIVILEVQDNAVQAIVNKYNKMVDAEKALQQIHEENEDEVIGWDDDYVQIENDYGNLITYQIVEIV